MGHWHATYEKLSELLSGLCAVQMKTPRLIVTAMVSYLMELSNQLNLEDRQAVTSQNAEHLQNMYLCVGDYDESEYEYLAVLLEESRVDRPRSGYFMARRRVLCRWLRACWRIKCRASQMR